jgi:N-acyl-D-amino-acid deacylase
MYDILIRQAKIVDGTGHAPYVADLGIIADRIAWIGVAGAADAADATDGKTTDAAKGKAIGTAAGMGGAAADAGESGSATADTGRTAADARVPATAGSQRAGRRIIDAKGMILAPGFVDMHSHSDYTLLIDNRAESKLRQGVTTEVVGNCGYSAAPMYSPLLEERRPEYEGLYGLPLDWRSFPEYLKRVEASSPSINYAFLVGHNTLRASAMGFDDHPPTPDQMARMMTWVEEALDCGAFGLSTGLYYAPACFAKKEELIQLASLVSRHRCGGILTSHIRNEGKGLLEALEEILTIAREAKVPLQISHLKTFGRENWGKLDRALEMIESARQQEGVEVTCDRYPYLAAQTSLQSLLPDWAQTGGSEAIVQRILDPSVRRKIVHYLFTEYPDEDYWASIYISLVADEAHKKWEGLNLTQLAESQAKYTGRELPDQLSSYPSSPLPALTKQRPPILSGRVFIAPSTKSAESQAASAAEAALDLLQEERTQVEIVQFAMNEKNLARILRHPLTMIGSDSSSRSVDGPLRVGKPHPRAFGTFPRLIREFCFEKAVLSLEEGVRKMTALPCQKLGLKDRGLIKEGMIADLVLFDPERIADQATYQNPFRYPSGIRLVVVNGRICLEEDGSIHTGQGKILQRGR